MAIIKHTAKPATAEEIRRAVGVTEEDRKVVDRVLAELGYTSGRGKSAGAPKVVAKTAAAKRTAAAKVVSKKPAPRTTSK